MKGSLRENTSVILPGLNPVSCREKQRDEKQETYNLYRRSIRKVFCAHYNDCLNICIKSGWEGFSCQECLAVLEDCPAVDVLEDAHRCVKLWENVFLRRKQWEKW